MACHQAARAAVNYIMSAGIQGWEKAGKPVEKGDHSS